MSESPTSYKSRQGIEVFLDPEEIDFIKTVIAGKLANISATLTDCQQLDWPRSDQVANRIEQLNRQGAFLTALSDKLT